LSYVADTQTDKQIDKQTETGKNITSLAEVTKLLNLADVSNLSICAACVVKVLQFALYKPS